MTKESLVTGIRIYLNPLELTRTVTKGKTLITSYTGDGSLDRLEKELKRLKYVTEAEVGHLNYIIIEPETVRFDVAERRAKRVEELVRSVIARWAARLPDKVAKGA